MGAGVRGEKGIQKNKKLTNFPGCNLLKIFPTKTVNYLLKGWKYPEGYGIMIGKSRDTLVKGAAVESAPRGCASARRVNRPGRRFPRKGRMIANGESV